MAGVRVPRSPGNAVGLGDAADKFVKAIRAAAAKFSTEIPSSVHKYRTRDFWFVSAGTRTGKWGWTPIHAWMFDEPHGPSIPKHPYFADRSHWYYQPYRPFLEEGAAKALQDAEDAYGEVWIADWCLMNGYK